MHLILKSNIAMTRLFNMIKPIDRKLWKYAFFSFLLIQYLFLLFTSVILLT